MLREHCKVLCFYENILKNPKKIHYFKSPSRVFTTLLICDKLNVMYKNLLDCYVSDFYVENHWEKLPNSWKKFFGDFDIKNIAEMLDFKSKLTAKAYPLSLLCLRQLIIKHSIDREGTHKNLNCDENKIFLNFFWKNVKEKKRHEIKIMSIKCRDTALKTNCKYIVDIGSGLGHLSRMLAYSYGFNVCTFEANADLVKQAYVLDEQFSRMLNKKKLKHNCVNMTKHIHKRIENDLTAQEFLDYIKEAFNVHSEDFTFGIIGLHPCGNLGATLLRLFHECKNATFINIVSCCYMKLTLPPNENPGFPLSKFCENNNFTLSYLSCEMACHSIENHAIKIRACNYDGLKIHAYRAALEYILENVDASLRHSQLCGVKYEDDITVAKYCEKALRKHNIKLPEDKILHMENIVEKTWRKVVFFYSVRLLLAPIIETIILYDKMLYIREKNYNCILTPAFNCIISPRNHILTANKTNYT